MKTRSELSPNGRKVSILKVMLALTATGVMLVGLADPGLPPMGYPWALAFVVGALLANYSDRRRRRRCPLKCVAILGVLYLGVTFELAPCEKPALARLATAGAILACLNAVDGLCPRRQPLVKEVQHAS